jgi:putative ABC transport system permease protein
VIRHWSQLATRNWRARPVRALGALLAIALGTAAVVWVTCTFESVRSSVLTWANQYVGRSHINIESPLGKYGTIAAALVDDVSRINGVATATPLLMRRLQGALLPVGRAADPANWPRPWTPAADELDLYGIDVLREPLVRDWHVSVGRPLQPGDDHACVVERAFAAEWGVDLGDVVLVYGGAAPEPQQLVIVGLVERRRVARFQKGLVLLPLETLQRIDVQPGRVTSIDIVVDTAIRDITAVQHDIVSAVARQPLGGRANVRNTLARIRQIEAAQAQQEVILVLLSSVAMLTALFIILSTLSMGMIERIGQLGLLRCIGLTGRQLAALMAIEVAPLGVGGVLLGIPLGLALAAFSVWIAPDYVGRFTISWRGLVLAAAAGLLTTAAAAALPMLAALRVSPLEAAHPRARAPRRLWLWLAAALAALLLLAQFHVLEHWVRRSPDFVRSAAVSVVLLYLAYACAAPLVVWLLGTPAVAIAARVLRVRARLLQDQVGHAVWRATGICSGLMVGLSLIVGLVVFSESFKSGWQFPKQFPEAYIWSFEQMREAGDDADAILADTPGLRDYTTCNAVNVHVEERPLFMAQVYASVTWFLGVEPAAFFRLVRVEFLEGDQAEAIRLLGSGGHVVIAEDFARSRNKHLGDEIKVFYGNRIHRFRIAGVITSPAIDIAAGYFQANTEMRVVASGSVIGTNADMARFFDLRGRRLILMNLAPPAAPVPPDWPPPPGDPAFAGLGDVYRDERVPLERRWARYHHDRLLADLRARLGAPNAYYGTIAELKDEIDARLTEVTTLLTAVPAVALLVAALGVANLMTANVTSRARQLAVLRAVGATRGLILRLVIGEAIVLGLLGGGLGLALGLHLAADTTTLTARMWGFGVTLDLPWGFIAAAAALTIGLCLLAGIIPARRAARANVVDALHVT